MGCLESLEMRQAIRSASRRRQVVRLREWEPMTDDAADSTRDGPAADLRMAADAMTEDNQQTIDELAAAEADYAAGNTISGEEVRRRYGLPSLKSPQNAVDAHVAAGEVTVHRR